jgi:hypothetical protein
MDWTPVLIAALPSLITFLIVQTQIRAKRKDDEPERVDKWIAIAEKHRQGEQRQEERAEAAEAKCDCLERALAEEQYYTEKLKAALTMHDIEIPERKKDTSQPRNRS